MSGAGITDFGMYIYKIDLCCLSAIEKVDLPRWYISFIGLE